MNRKTSSLEVDSPSDPVVETGVSLAPAINLVRKNVAVLGVYYLLDSILLAVFALALARYLGVAEFGRVAFAVSYGLLLAVLSDPGITLTLTKFVARDPDPANPWIPEGFYVRLIMIAVVSAVGLVPLGLSHYLRANFLLLTTILLSEQVRGLTLTYCGLFRGFQVMVYEAMAQGVERVSLLAAVYLLLRNGYGTEAVGFAYLGTRLLSLLTAVVIFRARLGPVRFAGYPGIRWSFIQEAVPLGVIVFAERISMYFVPLALVPISGEYAAGFFQAAFKVVLFPLVLCTVVGGSLFPAMSACFQVRHQTQKLYHYGVRFLWHMLLPSAALTLLFAPQILRIIYTERYLPAAPVLQILTPYYVLAALITVSYHLMPAIDHQRLAMKLSFAGVGLNLAVGIPMMRWWGARGAALALLFTQTLLAVTYWHRVSRLGYEVLRFRTDLLQWAGFLGAVGILFLLKRHFAVQGWLDLLMVFGVSCVVYGTILAVTRSLLPEEWQLLSDLKSRIWR